jgi:ABC-type molybdenum transport system ATPase subunit/photorepair protein PhrA
MYYGLDPSDVRQKIGVASRMLKKDVKARFHGRDLVLIEGE